MNQKPKLPNAVASLILGILSIVLTPVFAGLVLGIVGVAISGAGERIYRQNPDVWDGYNLLTAGRTMSIIGIVIASIYLIIAVAGLIMVGTTGFINLYHFID